MEGLRKPFQGVTNIVRFNWHFYQLAVLMIVIIAVFNHLSNEQYAGYFALLALLVIITTVVSLLVSYYVYDLSNLYTLNWLEGIKAGAGDTIVNINAGFDETSALLKARYPQAELLVFDFYDPAKHTEVSIERARKAYPPYPGTKVISTGQVPLPDNSANQIYLILAAHEIRNDDERHNFFKELNRSLKPGGNIIVTEHLRDLANLLAYNLGFFHFLSRRSWLATFKSAGLSVEREVKITPFITAFVLERF
jgi:ubiquinone/menaquinone biosynthesis C-methylase UbiE